MTNSSAATSRFISDSRAAILGPLARTPRCSRAEAKAAAAALGLSERQVFTLVRRLRTAGGDPAALRLGRSAGGRGKSRLPPPTEAAVQQLIVWLSSLSRKASTAEMISAIQRACRAQNLPPPSTATLRRRLKARTNDGTATNEPAGRNEAAPISEDCRGRPPLPYHQADIEVRLLASLYDSVGKQDGWSMFLDELTRSYAGGKGFLAVHDTALRGGWAQVGSLWEPDHLAAYNQHFVGINPWIPSLNRRPIGKVVPAEFMLPRESLLKTEFYQDFLRLSRIDSGVGVTVQQDGTRHMVVSVLFPHDTAERDPDAVNRLQRLVPHLLRVAQLNRQLTGLETRATTAETALDRLATAMLIVNEAAQVVHLNLAATQIIAAGDGFTVAHKALTAANSADSQALRRLIAEALRAPRHIAASPGGAMRISRKSGRSPYEVLVAPLSDTTLTLDFSGPLAVVFVRDPEAQSITPLERLQRLYALTGAEARLMQALLAGDTLDLIADRFAVSRETLRSQLKSVFLKTGTSGQLELLRLGLRGLAAFQG